MIVMEMVYLTQVTTFAITLTQDALKKLHSSSFYSDR